MCYTTFFNRALSIVSEITEIQKDIILSESREQEIVDARCLLIYALYKTYSISFKLIGRLVNRSAENVSYHIRNFGSRKSQCNMLNIQYEITIKKLQDNNSLTT